MRDGQCKNQLDAILLHFLGLSWMISPFHTISTCSWVAFWLSWNCLSLINCDVKVIGAKITRAPVAMCTTKSLCSLVIDLNIATAGFNTFLAYLVYPAWKALKLSTDRLQGTATTWLEQSTVDFVSKPPTIESLSAGQYFGVLIPNFEQLIRSMLSIVNLTAFTANPILQDLLHTIFKENLPQNLERFCMWADSAHAIAEFVQQHQEVYSADRKCETFAFL